jgi:hypothetical protein
MLPCASPVTMYPPVNGLGRYCSAPVGPALGSAPVQRPCGQCLPCRRNGQMAWSLRMRLESQMHAHSYFSTLSYAPEHLPEGGTLRPSDFVGFMKRYRERLGRVSPGARVRVAGCGEYGTVGKRPHYHAMLYQGDVALPDLYPWRRSDGGEMLFRSPLVEAAWGKGHVEIGSVTTASCNYVANYVVKRVTGDAAAEYLRRHDGVTGETWQVAPEFFRASRMPGIGAPWFLKWHGDVVYSDGRFELVLKGGERQSVPPYFMRLLQRSAHRVTLGKEPLPGLEGLEGIEDVVAMHRGNVAARLTMQALAKVNGDRGALADLEAADRARIAEYQSLMVSRHTEEL